MEELWLNNLRLIEQEEWIKIVDSLSSKDIINNKEEAKKTLNEKLENAIGQRMPEKKFGIFFSGGVDSTFIAAVCQHLNGNFICYTVGFQEGTKEPEDVTEAKKVAKKLGFEWRYKLFNLKEAERIIKRTVGILTPLRKNDVVNVGVGAVVLAAIELAKKDKINYFLSGLGSEEIFAGYERHEKVKDINAECWTGLKLMWSRDLVRDFNLAKQQETIIRTPFLDKEIIEYAMKLPGEWKIKNNVKKFIFREVAEEFLEEFAWRKKKAAQYGSCFDKAISKLARNNGFKLKREWLDKISLV